MRRALPVFAISAISALQAAGCASLTPEQQAAASRVLVMRSDPPSDCQNLGPVSGSRDSEGPAGIRARTVLKGGNTVRVDAPGVVSNDGMAFYCPAPKADPDAEPVP